MEKKHTGHSVGITTAKYASLSFGNRHDTHQQHDIDTQEEDAAEKAETFPDGTEDEIRLLLGHEIITGLGALEQPFPDETSAADGYFALFDIVIVIRFFPASPLFVFQRGGRRLILGDIVLSDGIENSLDLVRLEDMVEGEGNDETLYAYANEPDAHDQE